MKKDTIYCLEVIYSAVQNLVSKGGLYFRLRPFLPYCLYDIEGHIIPMNRDYKPIGLLNQSCVEYSCFNFLAIPRELIDFSDLEESKDGLNPKTTAWWLFSDKNTPIKPDHKRVYQSKIEKALFGKYGKDRKWILSPD